MSINMPSGATFLQLTSSSSGLNSLCTWTERARALVWRSRSREAFTFSLDKVVATDGVGKFNVDHGFAEGAITDDQFDVHFRLSTQLGDAQAKSAPVDPDGLAKSIIAVENCAETER